MKSWLCLLLVISFQLIYAEQVTLERSATPETEKSPLKRTEVEHDDLSINLQTQIASIVTEDSTISKLSDELFTIEFASNEPKYAYFGITDANPADTFLCDLIWPGNIGSFTCKGTNSLEVTVEKTTISKETYTVASTVVLPGNQNEFPQSVSDILNDHLAKSVHEDSVLSQILDDNGQRSQEMESMMALVFFFFSVMCILLINLTTMFLFYIVGNMWCCRCWLLWIFFAAMTVILTFSPRSGALGTLIWGIMMFTFVIVVTLWYCCCAKRESKSRGIEMGQNAEFDAEDDEDPKTREEDLDSEPDRVCCGLEVNYRPEAFTFGQKIFAFCHTCALLLLLMFACLSLYSFWQVDSYWLVDRETQNAVIENTTPNAAKYLAIIYGIPGAATVLYMERFMGPVTTGCGKINNQMLDSDSEKDSKIRDDFIVPYKIDMEMFDPSDYRDYDTVNNWFIRDLKVPRPIAEEENLKVISSAADCRVMVFQDVKADHQVWIKGSDFSVREVIGDNYDEGHFEGGSMIIFRLAPADYHQFHNPIHNGTIIAEQTIDGTLHSVSADAMTSANNVIGDNQRKSAIINSPYGKVAFVMIGAVCVGSIQVTAKEGELMARGDKIGFFQFGGSTIAAFFEKNMIDVDPDLKRRSLRGVETYIKQGQRVAIVKH